MDRPDKSAQTQEQLIDDLREVIGNAEELLKNTDQYTSLLYQSARAKLGRALTAANEELARFEDAELQRMIGAADAANLLHADKSGEACIMRAFQ